MASDEKENNNYTYQVLFETYNAKVYKIAYYIVRDENDAKDITQETFIRAFDNINNLRE